eukprot:COSAG01_NODE_10876_length_2064_cov_1.679389_1_plen_611_part_00
MKTLDINGVMCNIKLAREPERLVWDHVRALLVSISSRCCSLSLLQLQRRRQCRPPVALMSHALGWQLQYTPQERSRRKVALGCALMLLVALGCTLVLLAEIQGGRLAYADECRLLEEPVTVDRYGTICPALLHDPNTTHATAFRTAYERTASANAGDLFQYSFPRIDELSPASRAQLGPICYEAASDPWSAGQAAGWAQWTLATHNGEAAFSCHRIDKIGSDGTQIILDGGNMDAICYACFCSGMGTSKAQNQVLDSYGSYCDAFENDKRSAEMWAWLTPLIVVCTNQVIKRLLIYSVPLMREPTIESQLRNEAHSVFISQILNSAILIVVIRSSLPLVRDIPGDHHTPGANSKWHATVGVIIASTLAVQFLIPPLAFLWLRILTTSEKWWHSRRALTQNQLNRAHYELSLRHYDLASSYAEVLIALFITMVFGPGIPLLYWISALGFAFRFWVERWGVLRVHERPRLYSNRLSLHLRECCAFLLVVNALVSFYVVGIAGQTEPSQHPNAKNINFNTFSAPAHLTLWTAGVVLLGVAAQLLVEDTRLFPKLWDRVARRSYAAGLNLKELSKFARTTVHVNGVHGFVPGTRVHLLIFQPMLLVGHHVAVHA